jgi:hypothetical protein
MILESQEIQYNPSIKTAFTTINEPFYSAGKKLGWKKSEPGIGLNQSIIDFVMKRQCHLVVKIGVSNVQYWIYYDRLKQFMADNNCKYTVSGKTLTVISWKLFVRLNEHEEI